jgi:hypothetical protein
MEEYCMDSYRTISRFIIVSISLLILSACILGRPLPENSPKLPAVSQPQPAQVASPTPTALVQLAEKNTPAVSAREKHAFHINLALDEIVKCPGSSPCDFAYLPKFLLYFRGDIQVTGANLDGNGIITVLDASPCQTLMPDLSSCQVKGVTEGAFSISGQAQGNQLRLTLHLEKMPALSVSMTSHHPSGDVVLDLTPTYQEEMKKVFINAGIFEKEFQTVAALPASAPALYYDGSYTFGGTRTLHGAGSLIFISPEMTLPKAYQP